MSPNLCCWYSRRTARQCGKFAGAPRQTARAMILLLAAALTHSKAAKSAALFEANGNRLYYYLQNARGVTAVQLLLGHTKI
jgi:hypothetical protein